MGWNVLRYRIYEFVDFIDLTGDGKRDYDWYDYLILIAIALSLIPLLVKEDYPIFFWIDIITVSIFIVDYILRWLTADFRERKKGIGPFLRYPFTFTAIIDLVSILPSLTLFSGAWDVLRLFRILRTVRIIRALKVFRIIKAARYSRTFVLIGEVLRNSKDALIAVIFLAIGYILISALVIFNVEPDSFENFFDAVYWATISLTTVGYGDIYPVTAIGRLVAMLSSIFGIAIVALPAGIVTAGYMEELQKEHRGR